MTIQNGQNKRQYTGNGSNTVFYFPMKFDADSEIVVYVDNALQTITANYTLTGAGTEVGGDVTFVSAPAAASTVTILRSVPLTQATDYVDNDAFPASSHETALDKLTKIAQQIDEVLGRASILPVYSTSPPPAIATVRTTSNVFWAQITGAVDGSGSYPWNQVEPVNGSNAVQDLSGGLDSGTEGNAHPQEPCATLAANTVVLMTAVADSAGVTAYRFQVPGACP